MNRPRCENTDVRTNALAQLPGVARYELLVEKHGRNNGNKALVVRPAHGAAACSLAFLDEPADHIGPEDARRLDGLWAGELSEPLRRAATDKESCCVRCPVGLLGATRDRTWQFLTERSLQGDLRIIRGELCRGLEAKRGLGHARVEKGKATLYGVGHHHSIRLRGEQVSRKEK